MLKKLLAAPMLALSLSAPAAQASPAEILDLYQRFATAQNARDLAKVRALLLDTGNFLWVSDGMSIWGVDATLERMSSFQQAQTWRVEPDLAHARVVELDDGAAYLHLPLDLVIGSDPTPDRLHFLVSMLGARTPEGWKIAALFTTTAKPQ